MARSRNIKPGLFKNEILGVADPLYTLLFEGLWLLADREGRLEDRVLRIKAEIFPYRDGLNIDRMLDWLVANGFIIRYMSGINRYIQVLAFKKHQNPHKNEQPSIIPGFSDGCTTTDKIGTSTDKIGSARADSLSSDSLSSDSLIDAQHAEASKQKRKCRLPIDFELTTDRIQAATSYWNSKGRPDLSASDQFERFVNYFTANGKPMLDWDACWRNWYTNALTFNRAGGNHGQGQQTAFQSAADRRAAVARATHEYDKATDF